MTIFLLNDHTLWQVMEINGHTHTHVLTQSLPCRVSTRELSPGTTLVPETGCALTWMRTLQPDRLMMRWTWRTITQPDLKQQWRKRVHENLKNLMQDYNKIKGHKIKVSAPSLFVCLFLDQSCFTDDAVFSFTVTGSWKNIRQTGKRGEKWCIPLMCITPVC